MLAGYSATEIQKLVHYVLDQERIHFGKLKTWEKSDRDLIGPLKFSYKMGIKGQPEIIDLMNALTKANVTPHIVTASAEVIVAHVVSALSYPIKRPHIHGLRFEIEKDLLTPNPLSDYPQPIAEGKVKLIKEVIGEEPVLVAGDSANDKAMLIGFDTTEVRLVLHRPGSGLDFLYRMAVQDGHPARSFPATIVQGRDQSTGLFNQETFST